MQQSEMDFGTFATTAANHARRRNAPPQPDRDGLFNADGVAVICGRRECAFEPVSELFGDVRFKDTKITLTAIAPGRWEHVSVLAACTRACVGMVYKVDHDRSNPANAGGLDEIRIARLVGACGVQTYMPARGQYRIDRNSRTVVAIAGKPTRAFDQILRAPTFRYQNNRSARMGLLALEEAGLIHIKRGKRGGMRKCTWTARAYLAPERLAPADEEAMEMLA